MTNYPAILFLTKPDKVRLKGDWVMTISDAEVLVFSKGQESYARHRQSLLMRVLESAPISKYQCTVPQAVKTEAWKLAKAKGITPRFPDGHIDENRKAA